MIWQRPHSPPLLFLPVLTVVINPVLNMFQEILTLYYVA